MPSSTPPTYSTSRSTSSDRDTSAANPSALKPALASAAMPSSRCSWSEQIVTAAPSRARAFAAPRPIPRLPPVTNATRPLNGFTADLALYPSILAECGRLLPSTEQEDNAVPPTLAIELARIFYDGIADHSFRNPEGIAVGPDGSIWCGTSTGWVYRIAPDGSSAEQVASTGGFPARHRLRPKRKSLRL